jgi:hypothetical protein
MTISTITISTISPVSWGDELTPAERNDMNEFLDLDFT